MDDPVYFAGVYFPIASKQLQENNCAGSQRSTGGGGGGRRCISATLHQNLLTLLC